jgi:DNA-cytosine methyltransferase
MELTHASFFSGVGGLDLGLERAGWRTVSFSEIDPYACAVLAERWPGVPNLGDIVRLAASGQRAAGRDGDALDEQDARRLASCSLWTGGFPCQDLSVAGKRAGMGTHADRADTRSGLAYAFLDLVERHRPPAVLLENVPGLLSSHAGRDLGALLGRLGQLGYGWAFRILDAQWFGVPQRRRRVFILAIDLGLDPSGFGPAEVLAVGTRCGRDHAAEREAWARAAGGVGRGAGIVEQAISSKWAKQSSGPAGDEHHHLVVGAPPDADGDRAPDGLAGRPHGGEVVAIHADAARDGVNRVPGPDAEGRVRLRDAGLGVSDDGTMFTLASAAQHSVFVKGKRAQTTEDDETWRADAVSPTLNAFDVGDTRATTLVAGTVGPSPDPDGLDSNRYRVVGNGVVAPVAEWIGLRLADYFRALP